MLQREGLNSKKISWKGRLQVPSGAVCTIDEQRAQNVPSSQRISSPEQRHESALTTFLHMVQPILLRRICFASARTKDAKPMLHLCFPLLRDRWHQSDKRNDKFKNHAVRYYDRVGCADGDNNGSVDVRKTSRHLHKGLQHRCNQVVMSCFVLPRHGTGYIQYNIEDEDFHKFYPSTLWHNAKNEG